MAQETFNAVKLEEIKSKIIDYSNTTALKEVGNSFSNISGIVASEDSSLSNSCTSLSELIANMWNKISVTCNLMASDLQDYITTTQANENQAIEHAKAREAKLNDISSKIQNIDLSSM